MKHFLHFLAVVNMVVWHLLSIVVVRMVEPARPRNFKLWNLLIILGYPCVMLFRNLVACKVDVTPILLEDCIDSADLLLRKTYC